MAAYGIPESDIARVTGVDFKTLRKHYREELDLGEVQGDRAGRWIPVQRCQEWQSDGANLLAQNSGEMARNSDGIEALRLYREEDLNELSDDELLGMIYALGSSLAWLRSKPSRRSRRRPRSNRKPRIAV